MQTRQIERDRWNDFLEAFSAHNQTREISIDMEHNELGPQTVIERKPLLAMETDLKDDLEPSIVIVAGDPQGGEPAALKHRVMDPNAIWVREDDQGRVETLDIESDDGRTLIKFV
jgi:hypothetical protein